MSLTPTYTLTDVMTNILVAIQDILGEVAKTIAENAESIATIMVVGGLATMMVKYGSKIFRGVSGFFRGIF